MIRACFFPIEKTTTYRRCVWFFLGHLGEAPDPENTAKSYTIVQNQRFHFVKHEYKLVQHIIKKDPHKGSSNHYKFINAQIYGKYKNTMPKKPSPKKWEINQTECKFRTQGAPRETKGPPLTPYPCRASAAAPPLQCRAKAPALFCRAQALRNCFDS